MTQLPEQVSLKDYIDALRQADRQSIKTFVIEAEKKIPKEITHSYIDLTRALIKLFVVSQAMKLPEAIQIADVLATKRIMLNDWARYVILTTYILPHMASGSVQLQEAIKTQARTLIDAVKALEETRTKKEMYLYHEGVLRNTFNKIKKVMWQTVKTIGKSLVLFGGNIISVYNTVFDTLTYPIRKLLMGTIGGQLLSQVANIPLYFLINSYPSVALITGIHRVLSSPIIKQGAPVVTKIVSGEFWDELNASLQDITKDIDIEAIEKELDTIEDEHVDEAKPKKEDR